MADEIEDVLACAKSQGFSEKPDAQGYRRIYAPNGDYVTRYPATPGRKHRRYREVVIALRKHGLVWPPPSKKEQRSQRRKESS